LTNGGTKDMPEYTKDLIYQEMVKLCENAGMKIKYTNNIPKDAYAVTDEDSQVIRMPIDNEVLKSTEHAVIVLGHELAHQLLCDFYMNNEIHNPDNDIALYTIIEAHCNMVGSVLYKLAEKNAENSAEKNL